MCDTPAENVHYDCWSLFFNLIVFSFFLSFSFFFLLLGPYAVLTKDTMPQTYKRKRSWSRAVFSNLQRKGLEKRFEIQKYVTKPDRKQLAAMLGLTDAQVRCNVYSGGWGLHWPV